MPEIIPVEVDIESPVGRVGEMAYVNSTPVIVGDSGVMAEFLV